MAARPPAGPFAAGEAQILEHGQRTYQLEMLVDHADAGGRGGTRLGEGGRLTGHLHHAVIRAVEAGEDVHQARLAGAVLAQKRMHLAPDDGEVGAVQRHPLAEGFPDAEHADGDRQRIRRACGVGRRRGGGDAHRRYLTEPWTLSTR
jgi:hypothetical protein